LLGRIEGETFTQKFSAILKKLTNENEVWGTMMPGLTKQEIMIIVYRYIGVSGGYLGSFSYATHAEFYPIDCGLDINPYQYEGTTRERFITILSNATPDVQAKIIRGVLRRFPLDEQVAKPQTRTKALYDELVAMAQRLEGVLHIENPQITSAVVEQAIKDIEILVQSGQPIGCVDRIHTALHGYLRTICDTPNISYQKDDSMTRLFKLLRNQHPAFNDLGPRANEIERVLNSFANILDALNPVRDNASEAHPNEDLLGRNEALLIINVGRTLLHYIDAKIDEWIDTIPF